jgi:hypothetical protein
MEPKGNYQVIVMIALITAMTMMIMIMSRKMLATVVVQGHVTTFSTGNLIVTVAYHFPNVGLSSYAGYRERVIDRIAPKS